MKKYTFFLGLNDKFSKWQIVETEKAMETIENLVASQLWGGSISLIRWVFQHDDGTIVKENTIKIETLWYRDYDDYRLFAQNLREYFNQESVLMEVSEVSESFL